LTLAMKNKLMKSPATGTLLNNTKPKMTLAAHEK